MGYDEDRYLDRSYGGALEAAGATIHAIKFIGDYQGSWIAHVTHQGRTGFVKASYGSCSGCDHLQSVDPSTPEELASLGRDYLNDILSYQEMKDKLQEDADWDLETSEFLPWLDNPR